jgi:hypothetical protein
MRPSSTPRSTRRRFLQVAALSSATATACATGAEAQDSAPRADNAARALTDVIRERFGRNLTETQVKSVEQRLTRQLATAELLKRTRLDNGDEPAFLFTPGD